MSGLTINPPPTRGVFPAPALPTLIPPLPERPVVFTTLRGLALAVHRRRRGQAIQLTACQASYNGSDTFPAFNLYTLDADLEPHWIGALAIQGATYATLNNEIAACNPDFAKGKAA